MIIVMKKIILISLAFILISCGPSPEEMATIGQLTCNIMAETKNIDGALRIKEINAAREKLGMPAFLGSDDVIKESFEYGLCPSLVWSNDNDYKELLQSKKLQLAKEAEEARLKEEARQIALEEKRVADFLASLTDEEVAAYRCIEDNTIGVFDEAQYRAKNDTYEYRMDEFFDTAPSASSIAITGNMRKFEQDMQEHRKKYDEWYETTKEEPFEIREAYESSLTPIEKEFESCYSGKIVEEINERIREKGFEENSDEWLMAYVDELESESENEEAFFNSCTPKGKAKLICQSQGHLLTNIEKASAN